MLLLYYNFFSNKFWNITFFKLQIILGKDDIYHVRPVGRVVFWSYSKRLVLMSRESEWNEWNAVKTQTAKPGWLR